MIREEGSKTDYEFQKTIKQISAISPIMSKTYLGLYDRIPKMKSRLVDYLRDNI